MTSSAIRDKGVKGPRFRRSEIPWGKELEIVYQKGGGLAVAAKWGVSKQCASYWLNRPKHRHWRIENGVPEKRERGL